MNRPPPIKTEFESLPKDPQERHEYLVDIFGHYIFWAMREALLKSKALVESSEMRSKLGSVFEKPYSEAAKLTPEQQKIALELAAQTTESFAKNLLVILGSQGITFQLGKCHALQFRLTSEIRDVENMEIKMEEVINRGGEKAFISYWGRWLNQNHQGSSFSQVQA
jgi:hypothetical protein